MELFFFLNEYSRCSFWEVWLELFCIVVINKQKYWKIVLSVLCYCTFYCISGKRIRESKISLKHGRNQQKVMLILVISNLSREKCPFRSSHRRCSGKKNVLKNFANSTGKHCVGVSFDRSSHWRFLIKFVKNFVKKDSSTGVFLWSLRNVKEHLFWRTSVNDCFLPLIYFLRAASLVKLCCIALG